MDGLLVVDKPAGPTSHDVVARVRRALGERRVGHTGTLDPAATGVLPLVLGRATRLARFLSGAVKSYEATIRLGVATDTADASGTPVGPPYEGPLPGPADVAQALEAFRGSYLQQPPAFSAKKIDGRRSYRLARRARDTIPEGGARPAPLSAPVPVRVERLDLVGCEGNSVMIALTCSAGFYVRALAEALGERLGTGAHLSALRRTRSGNLDLSGALPLHVIERDPAGARAGIVPIDLMVSDRPTLRLTAEGARRAAHGSDLGPSDADPPWPDLTGAVRLVDTAGHLVAIAEPSERPGLLHPSVVLS